MSPRADEKVKTSKKQHGGPTDQKSLSEAKPNPDDVSRQAIDQEGKNQVDMLSN